MNITDQLAATLRRCRVRLDSIAGGNISDPCGVADEGRRDADEALAAYDAQCMAEQIAISESIISEVIEEERAAASEHTPEPWQAIGAFIGTCEDDYQTIAYASSHRNRKTGPNKADARRIVACVNACAGIPTTVLETGAPLRLIAAMHQES